MKLHSRSMSNCDQESLRTLLIDAAAELAGANSQLLEPKLPWDGYPILLADAQGHPVLVSFDTANSQAALLNGLSATEQLAMALPWINTVYEALQQQQKAPRLIVVSQEPPPGAEAVLTGCPGLKFFSYKVLRINNDTGIWLEPLDQENRSVELTDTGKVTPETASGEILSPTRVKPIDNPPSLSEEERAYFRQL